MTALRASVHQSESEPLATEDVFGAKVVVRLVSNVGGTLVVILILVVDKGVTVGVDVVEVLVDNVVAEVVVVVDMVDGADVDVVVVELKFMLDASICTVFTKATSIPKIIILNHAILPGQRSLTSI